MFPVQIHACLMPLSEYTNRISRPRERLNRKPDSGPTISKFMDMSVVFTHTLFHLANDNVHVFYTGIFSSEYNLVGQLCCNFSHHRSFQFITQAGTRRPAHPRRPRRPAHLDPSRRRPLESLPPL